MCRNYLRPQDAGNSKGPAMLLHCGAFCVSLNVHSPDIIILLKAVPVINMFSMLRGGKVSKENCVKLTAAL